ncbi:hypothetical protein C8Q80DRAFT_1161460 [Daedaleopsis nitida]|nr:hypothetical protein C8Q80DRAFT_1161460 [Daedaleopsis nitida]
MTVALVAWLWLCTSVFICVCACVRTWVWDASRFCASSAARSTSAKKLSSISNSDPNPKSSEGGSGSGSGVFGLLFAFGATAAPVRAGRACRSSSSSSLSGIAMGGPRGGDSPIRRAYCFSASSVPGPRSVTLPLAAYALSAVFDAYAELALGLEVGKYRDR